MVTSDPFREVVDRYIRAPWRARRSGDPKKRVRLDQLIERYVVRPLDSARCEFVHLFRQIDLKPAANHSHPHAAASRNSALRSLQAWVLNSGLTPYSTSASSREKCAGAHGFYMLKDLAQPPRYSEPTADDFIISIDDDYYRDPAWFAQYGRPMILYTFQPRALSGRHADATYHLDDQGRVVYRVNGGACYTHGVWNWTADHAAFKAKPKMFGHGRSWVYSIETRPQNEDHLLVLLTPVALVPTWALAHVQGSQVVRRDFRAGGFGVQEYVDDTGERVTSITRLGSYGSVELPTTLLTGVLERCRAEGLRSAHTAQAFLVGGGVEYKQALLGAGMLRDFALTKGISVREFRNNTQPIRYTVREDRDREERCDPMAPVKAIGRELTPAMTTRPATLPNATNDNSVAGVKGRVEKVRNDVVPPSTYYVYAEEFVSRTTTDGKIVPWTMDMVLAWQNKAAQLARNAPLEQWIAKEDVSVRAFMKSEPVADCGEPRNISQEPTSHVLRLSRYTLAAKDVWKRNAWYAPGKQPEEVAWALVKLAAGGYLTEADGSRFDGRVSQWLTTNVVRRAYLRICPAEERRELQELFDAEVRVVAKTREGKRYDVGASRLSGSPFTTDANTLITAAIDYFALRNSGLSPDDAWKRMGQYAGDDIISLAPADHLTRASAAVGMKHECLAKTSGVPVGFLGRVYKRLFEGDPSSMQDPGKTFSRIHLSMSPPHVPLAQAAANKAYGMLSMDYNQPLTAAYCRALLRCASAEGVQAVENSVEDLPYNHAEALREGHAGWPQDTITLSDVADCMGVDEAALDCLIRSFDAVQSFADFANIKQLDVGDPVCKVGGVEIDGDPLTPAPVALPAPPMPSTAPPSSPSATLTRSTSGVSSANSRGSRRRVVKKARK